MTTHPQFILNQTGYAIPVSRVTLIRLVSINDTQEYNIFISTQDLAQAVGLYNEHNLKSYEVMKARLGRLTSTLASGRNVSAEDIASS